MVRGEGGGGSGTGPPGAERQGQLPRTSTGRQEAAGPETAAPAPSAPTTGRFYLQNNFLLRDAIKARVRPSRSEQGEVQAQIWG